LDPLQGKGCDDAEEEEQARRIVALGRALSDPIRVGMLGMMAEVSRSGRGCCGLPADGQTPPGVCVCEFEDVFGLGQSRVSYHVKKLKEAGLVREQKRGKWSFYSLDQEAFRHLLGATERFLGVSGEDEV
jgi:ArsR family transcriptional regulator